MGLILDSFHMLAVNNEIEGIAALPGDRIFLVQLADAPRLSIDVLSWSRHFRNFLGQGEPRCGKVPSGRVGERIFRPTFA